MWACWGPSYAESVLSAPRRGLLLQFLQSTGKREMCTEAGPRLTRPSRFVFCVIAKAMPALNFGASYRTSASACWRNGWISRQDPAGLGLSNRMPFSASERKLILNASCPSRPCPGFHDSGVKNGHSGILDSACSESRPPQGVGYAWILKTRVLQNTYARNELFSRKWQAWGFWRIQLPSRHSKRILCAQPLKIASENFRPLIGIGACLPSSTDLQSVG